MHESKREEKKDERLDVATHTEGLVGRVDVDADCSHVKERVHSLASDPLLHGKDVVEKKNRIN